MSQGANEENQKVYGRYVVSDPSIDLRPEEKTTHETDIQLLDRFLATSPRRVQLLCGLTACLPEINLPNIRNIIRKNEIFKGEPIKDHEILRCLANGLFSSSPDTNYPLRDPDKVSFTLSDEARKDILGSMPLNYSQEALFKALAFKAASLNLDRWTDLYTILTDRKSMEDFIKSKDSELLRSFALETAKILSVIDDKNEAKKINALWGVSII